VYLKYQQQCNHVSYTLRSQAVPYIKKETLYVFPIYIIVLVVVVHKAVITFLSDDESMPWKDAWMLYSTHH